MSNNHVAIIGFGSIGQDLTTILNDLPVDRPDRLSVLVREGREDETRARLGPWNAMITSDLGELLDAKPDVVAECAGHGALAAFGSAVLGHGLDLVVASVGALADPTLFDQLREAALSSGAQCVVPAGAVGGIDALAAARLSGLKAVTYSGRKPPLAWAGTPAEQATDLATLDKESVFFEGSAREAALTFPKNANVAATIALAGLGMDDTKVRLIADPETSENIHEFDVRSAALDFSMRLVGKPSPLNPKTSRSTVFSVARAVLNRSAAIVI